MLHYNPNIARGVYLRYYRIYTLAKILERKLVLFNYLVSTFFPFYLFIPIKLAMAAAKPPFSFPLKCAIDPQSKRTQVSRFRL